MVRLLELAAPQFSDLESKEVQEFVDVGEYVLALETYIAIIEDEKMVTNSEIEVTVLELAGAMCIDSRKLMKIIRASLESSNR
jgi:hypothetical protein